MARMVHNNLFVVLLHLLETLHLLLGPLLLVVGQSMLSGDLLSLGGSVFDAVSLLLCKRSEVAEPAGHLLSRLLHDVHDHLDVGGVLLGEEGDGLTESAGSTGSSDSMHV